MNGLQQNPKNSPAQKTWTSWTLEVSTFDFLFRGVPNNFHRFPHVFPMSSDLSPGGTHLNIHGIRCIAWIRSHWLGLHLQGELAETSGVSACWKPIHENLWFFKDPGGKNLESQMLDDESVNLYLFGSSPQESGCNPLWIDCWLWLLVVIFSLEDFEPKKVGRSQTHLHSLHTSTIDFSKKGMYTWEASVAQLAASH